MIELAFLIASLLLNVGLTVVAIRFARKLLKFDTLVDHMVNDFDTNVEYFDKLLSTPVLEASDEIIEASRGMKVIRDRLAEELTQMAELTGTFDKIRQRIADRRKRANPPVVVD